MASFLDLTQEPDQAWISPQRLREVMHMQLQELSVVVGVHRNTLTRHPESPAVQSRLGQIVRIINRAAAMTEGNVNRAILWFRYEPLAGFDHQTAEQLVATGHGDAVESHLDLLNEGVYS